MSILMLPPFHGATAISPEYPHGLPDAEEYGAGGKHEPRDDHMFVAQTIVGGTLFGEKREAKKAFAQILDIVKTGDEGIWNDNGFDKRCEIHVHDFPLPKRGEDTRPANDGQGVFASLDLQHSPECAG